MAYERLTSHNVSVSVCQYFNMSVISMLIWQYVNIFILNNHNGNPHTKFKQYVKYDTVKLQAANFLLRNFTNLSKQNYIKDKIM